MLCAYNPRHSILAVIYKGCQTAVIDFRLRWYPKLGHGYVILVFPLHSMEYGAGSPVLPLACPQSCISLGMPPVLPTFCPQASIGLTPAQCWQDIMSQYTQINAATGQLLF